MVHLGVFCHYLHFKTICFIAGHLKPGDLVSRGQPYDPVISVVLCPNELIMAGIDVTFHELSKEGVKKCLAHQESV